jgi:uncharacterized protein YbjQ (UPF0145 family)
MLITTTNGIENRQIEQYLGVVAGDAVAGVNIFKDLFAGLRDIVGGRSGTYENVLAGARSQALDDMVRQAQSLGADGVVGVQFDIECIGAKGSMLMVSASGTAVRLR